MIIDHIKEALVSINGEWSQKNDIYKFSAVIAQRKAFLSKKTLTYIMQFRINDENKTISFTEMLKESGMGLSAGGDADAVSPGFGFKTETYSTGFGKPREGSIVEQSNLFGKEYTYDFEWGVGRKKIEEIAQNNNYTFSYHVTSIGL